LSLSSFFIESVNNTEVYWVCDRTSSICITDASEHNEEHSWQATNTTAIHYNQEHTQIPRQGTAFWAGQVKEQMITEERIMTICKIFLLN
jgi:hypothetical protein